MSQDPSVLDFCLEKAPLLANLSIEASAGTGKTYTLEQIVCRLVECYGLSIKQILLVTYTEKAAEELRQRIRSRLSLRLQQLPSSTDVLAESDLPLGTSTSEQARHNILQALNQYNEANISTIHSFFRRCLEQFALETGQSLAAASETAIDPKIQPVRELLLDELQKSHFSVENQRDLQWAGLRFSRPDKLLEFCDNAKLENFWHGHPSFCLSPGEAELAKLEQIKEQFEHAQGPAYDVFCQLAADSWPAEVFASRSSKGKLKNLPQNYNATIAAGFFCQLGQLAEQAANSGAARPNLLWELLELLLQQPPHPKDATKRLAPFIELLCLCHPSNLEANNGKFLETNDSLEAWPYYRQALLVERFFAAFAPCLDWRSESESLQALFASRFLMDLRRRIAPQLQMAPMLHGIRSFSDMVEGLYQVLILEQHGDPQSLLGLLRNQYRSVLVDEFQDTDPIQWQILYKIFGPVQGHSESYSAVGEQGAELQRSNNYIIVGDPKQSIYRFRGASASMYKLVQQGCDWCYRLSANYRSNFSAIGACNHLFANMWQGSVFKAVGSGLQNELKAPFLLDPRPQSKDQAGAVVSGDIFRTTAAFCFLDCDEPEAEQPVDKTQLRYNSSCAIVQQILRLLTEDYRLVDLEQDGQSAVLPRDTVVDGKIGKAVQPGDIAVLMPNRSSCDTVYQQLLQLGIPAQYKEKRSVFSDPLAESLHYFLLALCQPHQLEYSLRLLISPLFELSVLQARGLLGLANTGNANHAATGNILGSVHSEFVLNFMQQLFHWKEQVDKGQLLDVLQKLFAYGPKLHGELQALDLINAKETKDAPNTQDPAGDRKKPNLHRNIFSHILGRPQYRVPSCGELDSQVLACLGQEQHQDNRESYNNLRQLIEILATEQLNLGLDCLELGHFMAQQRRCAAEPDAQHVQYDSYEGQAIQVMTIHASKGLEFPIVFLGIGFSDGLKDTIILESQVELQQNWNSDNLENLQKADLLQKDKRSNLFIEMEYRQTAYLAKNPAAEEREAAQRYADLQRLFYVGLTRATSKIYFPFHSACRKSVPYLELLRHSLLGQEAELGLEFDPSDKLPLRLAVESLVQSAAPYFQLELSSWKQSGSSQTSRAPTVELQNRLRQRLLQNQAAVQQPLQIGLPQAHAFSPTPADVCKEMLLSASENSEPGAKLEAAVPSVPNVTPNVTPKGGYCRMQDDNLAQRYPAVSSFSSLQHSLQDDWSASLGHDRDNTAAIQGAIVDTETTVPELSRVPGAPESFLGQYLSPDDNLGSSLDKEREGLSSQPNSSDSFSGLVDLSKIGFRSEELYWHELLLSPGADLGKLLHDLLENVNYPMMARASIADLLQNEDFYQQVSLQSRGYFARDWAKQAYPALCRMIWHTLHSDLSVARNSMSGLGQTVTKDLADSESESTRFQMKLCQLSAAQRQHELEFLLAVPQDCRIDSSLFLMESSGKIQLEKGFLKGFIDLLFVHNGQFYLLDWKSNLSAQMDLSQEQFEVQLEQLAQLGEPEQLQYIQRQLYQPKALKQLMNDHHYQMQYLIYLAVVYSYLKLQYGDDFSYQRQFGGCYYLFLRGMLAGESGIYYHKPDEQLLIGILQALAIL